jgi:hypothetical protein
MAEKQALSPGDAVLLTDLAEIVFRPFAGAAGDAAEPGIREVLERTTSINLVSSKIRNTQTTSPAAKAIGDITEGAAAVASQECLKPQVTTTSKVSSLWNKLVWPDVKGAFWGGAQGATMATFWGGAQAAGMAHHLGPALFIRLTLCGRLRSCYRSFG